LTFPNAITTPAHYPLLRLPAVEDNAVMQTEPIRDVIPKRRQRWLQFSLRTLLIVVTLVAVPMGYVGWQAKIVRERKALAHEIIENGGDIFFVSEATQPMHRIFLVQGAFRIPPYPTVSGLRTWLGDDSALGILLPKSTEANTVKCVKRIFPEADVAVKSPD
jgi:hypothetical protein